MTLRLPNMNLKILKNAQHYINITNTITQFIRMSSLRRLRKEDQDVWVVERTYLKMTAARIMEFYPLEWERCL